MLHHYYHRFARIHSLSRHCKSPKRWRVCGTFRCRRFAYLWVGQHRFCCQLGYSGVCGSKKEGDMATPKGRWALIAVLYRADKIQSQHSRHIALNRRDAWCDDSYHIDYNKPVKRPFGASHEHMFRKDILYDQIIIPAQNMFPAKPEEGSAVFIHRRHPFKERQKKLHTAGCLAFSKKDMCRLVRVFLPHTYLYIS